MKIIMLKQQLQNIYQNIKASLWLIIVNIVILIAGAYVGMCDIINEKTK